MIFESASSAESPFVGHQRVGDQRQGLIKQKQGEEVLCERYTHGRQAPGKQEK